MTVHSVLSVGEFKKKRRSLFLKGLLRSISPYHKRGLVPLFSAMVPRDCSTLLAVGSSTALISPLLGLPDLSLSLAQVTMSPDHT